MTGPCPDCAYGDHDDCPLFGDSVERACCCGTVVHDVGCVGWLDHDGPCPTLADVERANS